MNPMLSKQQQKSQTQKAISQFSSVAQSCPTLCDPMNTKGYMVYYSMHMKYNK